MSEILEQLEELESLGIVPTIQHINATEDELLEFARLIRITDEGCWIWTGGSKGFYGRFKKQTAHRWLYLAVVGDLLSSNDLHHVCDRRDCVNPDHLEPLTRSEHNKQRRPISRKILRNVYGR